MIDLEPLLRRRRLVIAVFLAIAAVAVPGLGRLEIDNAPETFFVRDGEALARYRALEQRFGRDRALRLVLRGEALWTRAGLAWLGALEAAAEAVPGVAGAAGLYRHHRWHEPVWPPADPAAFRARVIADPVDRGAGWVGADGTAVTVLVGLYDLPGDERQRTLAELAALLEDAPPGIDARLAGLPVAERALDRALDDLVRGRFPLLVAVTVLALVAVFRRPRALAAPLALVALCLTVVFGAIGWAGARLDMVSIILAPLLYAITLATAVHLFAGARALGLGATDAVREIVRLKAWAVLWAGATTAVGFGSLTVSSVPPVRALGAWSAFGLAFLTLAALSFLPAVMAGNPGVSPTLPFERWARRLGRARASAAIARRRRVLAVFAVAALLALAGLPRLRLETDVLFYFSPDHPVRAELRDLEARGIGGLAAHLVLDPGEGTDFRRPEALVRLHELAARLRALPGALGAVGAGDLVAGVARASAEAATASDGEETMRAALARIAADPELARLLDVLLTPDGRSARVSLLVPAGGYPELEPLFARAVAEARAVFPEAEAWVSGRYPLVLAAQRGLLRTLVVSLALTLAVVAAMFRLFARSTPLALRLVMINLWPILGTLGLMGWLGVAVDGTTAMVAAVALGLAVDDTLHALGYLRRFAGRLDVRGALVETVERTAGAQILSTAILVAGFAVCATSGLAAVSRFAALAAFALGLALLADLVLLPALLAGVPASRLARLAPREPPPGPGPD